MKKNNVNKELIRSRLSQAGDSLAEAKTLLAEGADLNFVMNNLYYAFLYPVFGLLQARGLPATMQSTAISLFNREFVRKGYFEVRFLDGLRQAFDLRPACACEGRKKITKDDVERLIPVAEDFIKQVKTSVR